MILFTTNLASAVLAEVAAPNVFSQFRSIGSSASTNYTTFLDIYSGTAVDNTTFYTMNKAALDALPGKLISIDLLGLSVVPTGRVMSINNSVDTNAIGSGQASWFIFYSLLSGVLQQAMKGTVSALSGGGDLQLTNVNVVSGNPYKLSKIFINVPAVF